MSLNLEILSCLGLAILVCRDVKGTLRGIAPRLVDELDPSTIVEFFSIVAAD